MDSHSYGRRLITRYSLLGLGAFVFVQLAQSSQVLSLYAGEDSQFPWKEIADCSLCFCISWSLPVIIGLVFWVLPYIKNTAARQYTEHSVCFWLMLGGFLLVPAAIYSHSFYEDRNPFLVLHHVLMLAAGILYLSHIWSTTARSLNPNTYDLCLQTGALWLVGALSMMTLANVVGYLKGPETFAMVAYPAWYSAVLLGFTANTGLALMSRISSSFLGLPTARPSVIGVMYGINVVLLFWVLTEAWCTVYPMSYSRFAMAALGMTYVCLLFGYISRMKLLYALRAAVNTKRRSLVKWWMRIALVSVYCAGIVIAAMGIWVAANVETTPLHLQLLKNNSMAVGFSLSVFLAVVVPLFGAASLSGIRGLFGWLVCMLVAVWFVIEILIAAVGLTTDNPMIQERGYAALLSGLAAFLLILYILLQRRLDNPSQATQDNAEQP